MASWKKVALDIKRGRGYGQYIITARYKGKNVTAFTNDSECFDWLNDDSNKQLHRDAKRHAYNKIVLAFEKEF